MEKGDIVEDFELLDQTNTPRRLSDLLLNGPVVLFFYPAAMTKGCTAESCHFRDLAAEFSAVGAQRVGISIDEVAKQKQFSDKHEFDYPLLSDPDQKVAKVWESHVQSVCSQQNELLLLSIHSASFWLESAVSCA